MTKIAGESSPGNSQGPIGGLTTLLNNHAHTVCLETFEGACLKKCCLSTICHL